MFPFENIPSCSNDIRLLKTVCASCRLGEGGDREAGGQKGCRICLSFMSSFPAQLSLPCILGELNLA